ncbi:MAG: hypothetical protein Q8Q08_03205 [Candidatus Omnitrophota bacterium]|nr:hypothetical protein [Candidatus Omnitrophota bacterium]MDZ4241469.1 hypothetical protein [Candidatus Omnitrophota bacterium]
MPYDKSLDTETFKEVREFDESRITVGIYSYNGGEKKIQLTRENLGPDDQWRFAKLGRMTQREAKEIIPLMMKAVENM